ncbi:MAG TPA: hypothetical protein VGL56_07505 [Fimbriimonadaceae bacterium]
MYELYIRGRFGNSLAVWPDLDSYFTSPFSRNVVLRYKGKAGGAWVAYEVQRKDVADMAKKWVNEGADPCLITLNESAPDDKLMVQGEVMRSTNYLSLRYSFFRGPMRVALAKSQEHAEGLKALAILEHYVDPSSLDDLWDLLDVFDGAVVEFSTWSIDVGVVPHRNTVIWEVRHY